MNIFNITDIFNLFSRAGVRVKSYNPKFLFNNMGQINSPTPSTTKTNTRTSTATAFDHEGVLVTGEAGEIMLDGGRRVRVIVKQPNNLEHTDWVKANSTATGPNSVTFNSIWGKVTGKTNLGDMRAGDRVVCRLTVSGTGSGANSLNFRLEDSDAIDNGQIAVVVTDELTTYAIAYTLASDVAYLSVVLDRNGGTVETLELHDVQIQKISGQSNDYPAEFIDTNTDYGYGVNGVKWYSTTNGNSVLNNVVTEAPGTAITPVPQVLMQPQRTNLLTYSRDLTNAAWVETGTSVAALDAVGMDGVANSVCTLTDNDGALTELLTQTNSTAADTSTHCARIFILKDVDTGRFPGVSLDLTTSGTQQRQDIHINTQTGALASSYSVGAGGTFESNLQGDWWEVLIEVTNVNNTNGKLRVTPAAGTTIGSDSVAATGSIIVGNVEFHENKTIEEVRGTSPIFTEAAAVTVDNDLIEIADWSNFAPLTSGLMLFAFTPSGDWAALGAEQLLYGGASANLLFRSTSDDGLKATDGTSTPSILSGHTIGTEIIASVYWDADINIFQIGYYEVDNTTQHWDTSPATFTTITAASLLEITKVIVGAVTIRGVQVFENMPSGGVDRASIESWIEANQEAEILKVQA